jgi:hypothetical protein
MTTATAIDRISDTAPDAFRGSSGHSTVVRDRRDGIRDDPWIERRIKKLRDEFAPIRQELKDREYFLTRTQKRKRKDKRVEAKRRKKEKQKNYLEWRYAKAKGLS